MGQASVLSMAKNGAEYYNESWKQAAAIVTAPPLRDESDIQEVIVEAALEDVYASVCSNHSPYTDEDKKAVVSFQKIFFEKSRQIERSFALCSLNVNKVSRILLDK